MVGRVSTFKFVIRTRPCVPRVEFFLRNQKVGGMGRGTRSLIISGNGEEIAISGEPETSFSVTIQVVYRSS